MDLPVEFPSETEELLAEVASFRALSPAEQVRVVRQTIAEGIDRIKRSPDADAIRAYLDEQEELGKQNVREFVARHAHRFESPSDP